MNGKDRVAREIQAINRTTLAAVGRAESLHDIDLIKQTAKMKLDLLEELGDEASNPELRSRIEAARRDL